MTAQLRDDECVGLALLAHELNRDLQRAARVAGGAERLARMPAPEAARLLGCATATVREAFSRATLVAARARLLEEGISSVAASALPPLLREVFDPPFGLFAQGRWSEVAAALRDRPVVAIVGARHPTAAGAGFARTLAGDLAARGAVIVSGLALGIDGAAHEGALDEGGVTVAVLGCGLGQNYPRRHQGLRQRIAETGAVLSEYWSDTEPAPWRFPARNRIVAGLAHAVVVVEARGRSGALITADFALEAGRVALAVPGYPWSEVSQGCNELIRCGAGVCLSADDVVAEVAHSGWREPGSAVADGAADVPEGPCSDVYALLRREPLRVDQLSHAAAISPAAATAALAQLEVQGLVVRGEGQTYWAVSRSA